MRTIKKNSKRWFAMVLSLVMCLGLLQTTSFAANWNPGDKITINVRVYDQSNGAVYNVGTDSVEKGNPELIQSVAYQIPQLTKFVSANQFGRVTKVVGNWYFPAGDSQPGANVEWSCNANSVTMTYWVNWYTNGSGSGSGSTGNDTVNIGGSGSNVWTQTITYHSNYPSGQNYSYKVTYNVRYYATLYNTSSIIKSLADVSFNAPNGYEAKTPIWNTNAAGTGTSYGPGSNFTLRKADNGKNLDLYAQWQTTGGTEVTPVTLTYMDGTSVYGTRNYFAGDTATAILCTTEKAGYTFAGWADSANSQTVKYRAGIEFIINSNMTLYAVWVKDSSGPEATDCITVNKVFSGVTIDEFPWDFSINYKAVNTAEPEYSTTKTLTMDNAEDFDETTMTVTWLAPHYSKTGGSTVTITENCDVDEYTYTTTTSKGTVNDSTHTVSMSFVSASTKGSVTLTNTYTPASVTPENPKLDGITKTRITFANADTLPTGFDVSGINLSATPQIPQNMGPVTLLYRISVSGTEGAKYIISDTGADLMNGYSWSGEIGAEGVADIYVTRTVSLEFAKEGNPVENTAYVVAGEGTDPSGTLASNLVSTKVYGRVVANKDGSDTDASGISNYAIQVDNLMGTSLSDVTVIDNMDSRADFIEGSTVVMKLADGTESEITNFDYQVNVETNTATWVIRETIPVKATIYVRYRTIADDKVPEGTKLDNHYLYDSTPILSQNEAAYAISEDYGSSGELDTAGSGVCTVEVIRTTGIADVQMDWEGE